MTKLLIPFAFILIAGAAEAQSYELASDKDTINYIDQVGKKQGKWVLMGKHKPGNCYKATQKVEEGNYQQNRKTGNWMEYYCNGNQKNNLTFVNGRPDGYAMIYYENGKLKEEGNWKVNRWIGDYKLYYENGLVQHDFKFNSSGRREGIQVYKYENGQLAIEGNFSNGRETGEIKEYYETGDIKAIKTFNDGNVDVASIKQFDSKKAIAKNNDAEKYAPSNATTQVKAEEVVAKSGPTVLNGKHILYNKNKQISKDGVFKDNRLMEGKAFIYNENGILSRVAIYKSGIYVGDGNIEN